MKSIYLVIVINCLSVAACDRSQSSSSANSIVRDQPNITLGAGFNSANGLITSASPCIQNSKADTFDFFTTPIATLRSSFSRDFDYHSELRRLTFGGGVGPLQVQTNFLHALQRSALSVALVTEFDYTNGTVGFKKPRLTPYALSLVNEGERLKNCGDEYVDQLDVGARFYSMVIFHFKQSHEKLRVSIQVLLDLLFGTITLADIGAENLSETLDTSIDMKVSQIGGDQKQFESVKSQFDLEHCGHLRKSETTNRDYVKDMDRCLNAYNASLKYARKNFLEQIRSASESRSINANGVDGLVVSEARTRRYADAGLWQWQPKSAGQEGLQELLNEISLMRDELAFYRGTLLSLEAIKKDAALGPESIFRLDQQRLGSADSSIECARKSIQVLENVDSQCNLQSLDSMQACRQALSNLRLFSLPYLEAKAHSSKWPIDKCN